MNDSIDARAFARQVRRIVLDQSRRAGVGHIGSALSVADIVAALYSGGLRAASPRDAGRDRFVLSKGHAALALYAALFLKGWISQSDLDTYCSDGTLLGVHPEPVLPGVDFATGSLGQGLSMGVGAALAARLQGSERKSFVLLSDAECNEGSTWEAVMFAAHHRLGNLTAVVDVNKQQALGFTADVLNLEPLGPRWTSFGWNVIEMNGHDAPALRALMNEPCAPEAPPRVILARTTFGKGVSFMEGVIAWHYLPLSAEQYQRAIDDIGSLN